MLYDPSGPSDPPRPPRPPAAERDRPAANDEAFLRAVEEGDPPPTRAALRMRNVVLFALAALALAETFWWWGGMRVTGRPTSLVLETAIGAACITAVAIWAAVPRGKSMLGRSATVLGVAGLLTPAALFVWKIAVTTLEVGTLDEWPTRPGFKCLRLSITMGLFPLLAMVLVRKNSDPNHPRLTGASLGVAAGACAWVFTDLWCPVAYVPHLVLGHLLPISVLAALGAGLGHWLIHVRPGR